MARPLDWVGMANIALPLRVATAGGGPGDAIQVAASVDEAGNVKERVEPKLAEGLTDANATQ